ncbi:MAG: hypothetical protein FD129_914 [bacterium]|nr:MAG: hypothetical protein FD129_914 [bacterium]
MALSMTVSIAIVFALLDVGLAAGAGWTPFVETIMATAVKSVSAGRTAQAFVGSGDLVDIRSATVSDERVPGFMTGLTAFVVNIENVTLEGQESAGAFGVHVVVGQLSGDVVGFYTTARVDTVPGGNDPSGAKLREYLSNSGRFSFPLDAPQSSFSDILITACCCGVPIVRAPALIGRLMVQQSVVRHRSTNEMKSSTVWLVSGVGFPIGQLELRSATQTHALIVDGGGTMCSGFDTP